MYWERERERERESFEKSLASEAFYDRLKQTSPKGIGHKCDFSELAKRSARVVLTWLRSAGRIEETIRVTRFECRASTSAIIDRYLWSEHIVAIVRHFTNRRLALMYSEQIENISCLYHNFCQCVWHITDNSLLLCNVYLIIHKTEFLMFESQLRP